jgi:hypothetical protein
MPFLAKSILDEIGQNSCCFATAKVSSDQISTENVEKALHETIAIHPRLACIPRKDYVKQVDASDLEIDFRVLASVESAEKEVERELNEPLKYHWRLTVYYSKSEIHVLFTLDHRLGDARSTTLIVKTLVKQLTKETKLIDHLTDGSRESAETAILKSNANQPIEDEFGWSELFGINGFYAFLQLFNRFKRSKDAYTDKPLESFQSGMNSCKSIRLVGRHFERIQETLVEKKVDLESFVTMAFITSFRQLVESTTTIEYSPVREKFQHLFTFVLPVAIMIVFCYQNGMDSLAWLPSLMVFMIGRKVARAQTIKLQQLTFGYSVDARPLGDTQIGNFMVPFLNFDYRLHDKDLFWGHVVRIKELVKNLKARVPAMIKWHQIAPCYLSNPLVSKKDVSGMITVVDCGDDELIDDMQCVTFIGNRALVTITITKLENSSTIYITYPTELFTFADMDLFIGQFQAVMIRALGDDKLDLSHKVHK